MDQKSEAYVNFQNFQKVGKKFVKDIANGRDAIKWYTSETSIYKLVNNLLRSTRHPAEIYYVQPFFKSLYNQIQTIFKQKIQKQGRTNFKCFRGAWLTEQQIFRLKSSRGEAIISLGFLSTTLDEKTSNNFGNCLLQIEEPEEQTNDELCPGYANIENYSNHPEQKEILFNPLNNLVVDFFDHPKFNKITFCLRYAILPQLQQAKSKEGGLLKTTYMKLITKQEASKQQIQKALFYAEIGPMQREGGLKVSLQGQVLIEDIVNLQLGKQYWQKYSKITKESMDIQIKKSSFQQAILKWFSNWNISRSYTLRVLRNCQEYQKYICKAKQKIKVLQKLPKVWLLTAGELIGLGGVYIIKGLYSEAIYSYQKARKIYQNNTGSQDVDYADLLMNIGRVYYILGEYRKAMDLYQQAKQAYKSTKGIRDVDYATVLVNIGSIQKENGEYEKAIKSFSQAKKIVQMKLGRTHIHY